MTLSHGLVILIFSYMIDMFRTQTPKLSQTLCFKKTSIKSFKNFQKFNKVEFCYDCMALGDVFLKTYLCLIFIRVILLLM